MKQNWPAQILVPLLKKNSNDAIALTSTIYNSLFCSCAGFWSSKYSNLNIYVNLKLHIFYQKFCLYRYVSTLNVNNYYILCIRYNIIYSVFFRAYFKIAINIIAIIVTVSVIISIIYWILIQIPSAFVLVDKCFA